MSTGSLRSKRIADLVKRELAAVIRQEIADPRLQNLSLSVVDMSPDLKNALVYFTLPDASEVRAVETVLKNASGFFRKSLADRCELKYVPRITFKYDRNIQNAENLIALISKANRSEKHATDDDESS